RSDRHRVSVAGERQETRRETSGLAGFALRPKPNGVAEAVWVHHQVRDLSRRIDLLKETREKGAFHQLTRRTRGTCLSRTTFAATSPVPLALRPLRSKPPCTGRTSRVPSASLAPLA